MSFLCEKSLDSNIILRYYHHILNLNSQIKIQELVFCVVCRPITTVLEQSSENIIFLLNFSLYYQMYKLSIIS